MKMQSLIRCMFLAAAILVIPMAAFATPRASHAEVIVSVAFAPPPLPVYVQPVCPGDGYIWVPGYWAYGDDDYYWVPGTWVLAPEAGFLWTPAYWGWSEGVYVFHPGYWGPRVGFYGGINYGFGYFGVGFEGGRWDGGRFFYNRAVTNVNVTIIHNVYETRVNERVTNRVSFNGGEGGVVARPRPEEEDAARDHHIAAVPNQMRHQDEARGNRELRASVNRGKPPIAATPRPAAFEDRAVVRAKEAGGRYRAEPNRLAAQPRTESRSAGEERPAPRPETAVHPRELPPPARHEPPSTGDVRRDQKFQQQQQNLRVKQDQERQKLQVKQEQEHQRLDQQRANDARRQETEQHHQQQTQQMAQRHTEQQQHLEQKQNPHPDKPHKPQQ